MKCGEKKVVAIGSKILNKEGSECVPVVVQWYSIVFDFPGQSLKLLSVKPA